MKQKTVNLCLITSLLISSYSSGMLLKKTLQNQKYIRTYRMKSLGSETIFNTNNNNVPHQLELLGNLYDRNEKIINDLKQQIKRLELQNNIANSASYSFKLDKNKLNTLEIQIHEGFNNLNEES